MLRSGKATAPFTIIVRTKDEQTEVHSSETQVVISFILPEPLILYENYYCKLVHVSGFERTPLLVSAARLVDSATICEKIVPILGTSVIQANQLQPVNTQYVSCAQTLTVERLDGAPFIQDYQDNKNIAIILHMLPESWVLHKAHNYWLVVPNSPNLP